MPKKNKLISAVVSSIGVNYRIIVNFAVAFMTQHIFFIEMNFCGKMIFANEVIRTFHIKSFYSSTKSTVVNVRKETSPDFACRYATGNRRLSAE